MSNPLADDIARANLPPSPVWPTALVLLITLLACLVWRPYRKISEVQLAFEMGRRIGRRQVRVRESFMSRRSPRRLTNGRD